MAAADRLLSALDRQAYPARQRLLAQEARRLAGTSDLRTLLADLAARDRYCRQLAVRIAQIAGERQFVADRLTGTGPDHDVTAELLHAAVVLGLPEETLTRRLPTLPRRHRFGLYRLVRRIGRPDLADALFQTALTHLGEQEAVRLLPRCSAGVAARYLPELAFAVTSWGALAHAHPVLVLDQLQAERALHSRFAWSGLVMRRAAALVAAAEPHPGRVLALLEELEDGFDPLPLLRRRLRALVRHDARRVAALMLDPGRGATLPAGRHLVRDLSVLDDETLVRLARTVGPRRLASVLHALPPARRPVVYRGVVGDRDPITGGYPLRVLDELPHADRHAEAARLLALRSVRDDRVTRLAVQARAAWSQAEPVLREVTRQPSADERRYGYALLFRAAGASRDPGVVEDAIGSSTRLDNEQDPVRAAALNALAAVPARLYTDASTRHLVALSRAALSARDCSPATRQHIGTLGHTLVVEGSSAGRAELLTAGLALFGEVSEQGWVLSGGLGSSAPRGVEAAVFDALRPRLDADARRGRYDGTLALATDLGRRAWTLPGLQDLLARACRARNDAVVRRAVGLWLAPPATRDERVAVVFGRDRSTVTIHPVAETISRRRTDLLDDVLSGSLHGRFLARRVQHVPVLSHPERWLPRQVAAYRNLQVKLLHAPNAAGWERGVAVHALAHLPGSDAVLTALLQDPDRGVVQDAMTALGHADDPSAALALLLERADGDDAHVAVSAAARCAGFVAPDRLADALRIVAASPKVTARKEAARLISLHRVPDALGLLQGMWDAPAQHRDVRRAIASVLSDHLDDDRAWLLLERAAADADLATVVLAVDPSTLPRRHRTAYAGLVRTVAGDEDPDIAVEGLTRLASWVSHDRDAAFGLLVDVVCDLSRTSTWRAALESVVDGVAAVGDAEPLLRAARTLLDAHRQVDADHDAGSERDLPARQRLAVLSARLAGALTPTTRPAAAQLADLVAAEPDCLDIAVQLRVSAVPWTDVSARLPRLFELAATIADASLGGYAVGQVAGSLVGQLRRLEADTLVPEATALLAGAAGGPFVALGIVTAAGRTTGWPESWRAALRELRAAQDPTVRRLAAAVTTASE